MPAVPSLLAPQGLAAPHHLLGIEERLLGARSHRDLGLAAQLDDLERVVHGLVEPGVAGDDADPHHVHVGGQEQHGDGHRVGAAGPRRVLVDEHLDPLGCRHGAGQEDRRRPSQADAPDAAHAITSLEADRERQTYRQAAARVKRRRYDRPA
jgi:hypothetical protein